MKFAHQFKQYLREYPQEWADSAIPYSQLKKCLKKVIKELHDLGLDPETLAELAAAQRAASTAADLGFQYQLDEEGADSRHLRPRLTVFVQVKDGLPVDARLSPATRTLLERIAEDPQQMPVETAVRNASDLSTKLMKSTLPDAPGSKQIEVPLVFDGEFFNILQTDVSNLDNLQQEEETKMKKDIQHLGQEIARVTKPSRGRKAKDDLAKWRDIFELYIDARVFFSTRENDHGARSSAQALTQLQWFQDEVSRRKLAHNLRSAASREAFTRFLNINALLLQNLKFQEINQLAVTKILKKFDKRTCLGVSQTFVVAVHSDHLLAGSIAKNLCAQVSSEIISVVPDIQDFLCPICFAVAYWPIRLDCNHVFCSRCMVKMQRKVERFCPLCRGDVINNFDTSHADFLKRYFPKEVKEKVRANELERGKEIFGPDYTDRPCSVM